MLLIHAECAVTLSMWEALTVSTCTSVTLRINIPYSVRMEGVEPTCLAALDPKSSASASFATSAFLLRDSKIRRFHFKCPVCLLTHAERAPKSCSVNS